MTSEEPQAAGGRSGAGSRWTSEVRGVRWRRCASTLPFVALAVLGPASVAAEDATVDPFEGVRVTSEAPAPAPSTPASTPALTPAVTPGPTIRQAATAAPVAPAPVSTVLREADQTPPPAAAPVVAPVGDRPPAQRLTPPVPDADIAPLTRPVVVLYGDSLAWEARDVFVEAFADRPEVDVVVHTFGGTAICDWLDQMATDAATLAPGAVVVEFSGNNFTPCMLDTNGQPLTGEAYTERYATDAAAVIATFAPVGTQIVFAAGPQTRTAADAGVAHTDGLNAMYARLASDTAGVRFADAGGAVLANGQWSETLPCLPAEPCTGGVDANGNPVNVVRAPDGIHFCPASGDAVEGVTGSCPVWSSGAFRFGHALAQPVIDSLDAAG